MRKLINFVVENTDPSANLKRQYDRISAVMKSFIERDEAKFYNTLVNQVQTKVDGIIASYAEDEDEDSELDASDVAEIFADTAAEVLKKYHLGVVGNSQHRLNDFFARKPEVEDGDELNYFTAENAAMEALALVGSDLTDSAFDRFVDALEKFTEQGRDGGWGHWGVDSYFVSDLSVLLPLYRKMLANQNKRRW